MLQSESFDALRGRSYKDQARTSDLPSKVRVLGKKSITRDDGVCVVAFGCFNNLVP